MTNNLNALQVRILTYGIYALMAFLTVITGWAALQITSMPKEYVMMQRYETDLNRGECALERIESKLDSLIFEHGSNK